MHGGRGGGFPGFSDLNLAVGLEPSAFAMDSIPSGALSSIFQHATEYADVLSWMRVCLHWCRCATAGDLHDFVQERARVCHLPSRLLGQLERSMADWVQFGTRQLRLQSLLQGKYMGTLTPENVPESVRELIDWEQPLDFVSELKASDDCARGRLCQRIVEQADAVWCASCDWLVLDRRCAVDRAIWKRISQGVTLEVPEARWEDGDLYCGVRGSADFRPAVDPAFLDLSELLVLLCGTDLVAWSVRLFAPCAWMFSKKASSLEQLDHHAYFRQENTASALVLGKYLERPLSFSELEIWVRLMPAPAPSPTPARRRRSAKERFAEPRDFRSGRNPKGLNLYIPRRKSEVKVAQRPKQQVLTCEAAEGLEAFLQQHRPTAREAEQLCVWCGVQAGHDEEVIQGLCDDAARLERSGALSQASVLQLAKKWQVLTGKWFLQVPEWRIDDLFSLAAQRLKEEHLRCCQLVVHMPIDQKFMLSAHATDFTDRQAIMSLGKSLRAAARHGLRSPSGDWGELLDDPFAGPGKKVSLVFKPEVFSKLNLHKNNPLGIKTSLYSLDL